MEQGSALGSGKETESQTGHFKGNPGNEDKEGEDYCN
jgi:hypothetical protein